MMKLALARGGSPPLPPPHIAACQGGMVGASWR